MWQKLVVKIGQIFRRRTMFQQVVRIPRSEHEAVNLKLQEQYQLIA